MPMREFIFSKAAGLQPVTSLKINSNTGASHEFHSRNTYSKEYLFVAAFVQHWESVEVCYPTYLAFQVKSFNCCTTQ